MRDLFIRVLTCVLLAGCTKVGTSPQSTGGPEGGRHAWTNPRVLRIGVQATPNTLNPIFAANTTESMLDRLLFDVLISVDPTGTKEVPILASAVPTLENGGISRDGLTLTYHLRPGMRWQDGAPLTSRDVKFTWSAVMNPNNNVLSQAGYSLVRSVDTPNPTTVVFHMKRRFSPAINTLFGESDTPYGVLPEHLLGGLHDINHAAFNSHPVGSGPFQIKEWARGDHITLVANDRYFLGRPKLREIDVRFIPDENTELNELRTHDIDWQFEASEVLYDDLKANPGVRVILQQKNEYARVQMNTQHAPLDDPRVRRAIAYALDTQKLVDDLTHGTAVVADQDLPPFMWAHAADVARYPHDVARASALLAQAGYVRGPDGYLVRHGKKLTLTMVYNVSNATRRQAVVLSQAMLRQVGIELDIKAYQSNMLFATMGQGGILQNGNYDLAFTAWVSGIDPDQSTLVFCADRPPHGTNETRYCNPALDAAENDALDHFDRPTRKKAYAEVEAILTRDIPQLPIWWPRQIQPINPDFRNFSPNPITESWNAYTWDI